MNYIKNLSLTLVVILIAMTIVSCSHKKKEYLSFEEYPVRTDSLVEMVYTSASTAFSLWAPTAQEVRLMIYNEGLGGNPIETIPMKLNPKDGTWRVVVNQDLIGKFYTFNVKVDGKWLGDTPGINARAVGANGKRAAIIDMKATNPAGWESDRGPKVKSPADIVLYEVHHRDFSIDSTSGIKNKGKYLAYTEKGTKNPDNQSDPKSVV